MGKDFWTRNQPPEQQPELPPLAAAVAGGDESAKRQARLRAESASQATRTDAAMREFEAGLKDTRQAEIEFYRKAGVLDRGPFAGVGDEGITDEMLEEARQTYRDNPELYQGPQGPTALEQLNQPTAQVRKNLAAPPPGGWPKTKADVEAARSRTRTQPAGGFTTLPVPEAVGRAPAPRRPAAPRRQPVREEEPRLTPPPRGFDLAYPKAKKPFELKEPGALLDGYKLLYGSVAPKSLRPRVKGGR